jgi:hypothetical protein
MFELYRTFKSHDSSDKLYLVIIETKLKIEIRKVCYEILIYGFSSFCII